MWDLVKSIYEDALNIPIIANLLDSGQDLQNKKFDIYIIASTVSRSLTEVDNK